MKKGEIIKTIACWLIIIMLLALLVLGILGVACLVEGHYKKTAINEQTPEVNSLDVTIGEKIKGD